MRELVHVGDANQLVRQVETYGELLIRGSRGMNQLAVALSAIKQDLGLRIVYDPESDPDLLDYLIPVGGGAIGGAVLGRLVGGFAVAALGLPAGFATAAMVIGGLAGASRGHQQVLRGLRVVTYFDHYTGQPIAELAPIY